jgi:hypothetical protein
MIVDNACTSHLSKVRTTMPYNISSLSRCPPSGVQKECQQVIHFIAHNEVFQMQDLNDEQKKSKLFVLVHGDEFGQDPNQLSLNSLFLSNLRMSLNGRQ